MNENIVTLSEAIERIDALPWNYALFLQGENPWNEQTPCAVLDPDDSDDPDEDPDEAKQLGLKYAMSVADAQDVVANAKAQTPDIDMTGLIGAFNFYHAHDAFVKL